LNLGKKRLTLFLFHSGKLAGLIAFNRPTETYPAYIENIQTDREVSRAFLETYGHTAATELMIHAKNALLPHPHWNKIFFGDATPNGRAFLSRFQAQGHAKAEPVTEVNAGHYRIALSKDFLAMASKVPLRKP
jgi:hypothetical protein